MRISCLFFCLFALFLSTQNLSAQDTPKPNYSDDAPPEIIGSPDGPAPKVNQPRAQNEDAILDFPERQATFPGGQKGVVSYLQENIVYPASAIENKIEGRVILRFVVEKDGSVSNVNVLRRLGNGCDEEAVRVVESMTEWTPAQQNGNVVRQLYTLPVFFRLPKEEPKSATQDSIYKEVDKSCTFVGGEAALMRYLQESIIYPKEALDNGVTGRVIMQFVVEKDGSISNIEVLRKLGAGCDEEGIRVIKAMPKWTPAEHQGKIVRQRYVLPIFYKMSKKELKNTKRN